VRQVRGLSPELFNTYINKVITEWKQTTQNGIQVTSRKVTQTILYADDQDIIAKSEDDLQVTVNELNKIAKKYNMKISTSKTKAIGVCGKNTQRVKTEFEGKIIEQVSNFTFS
jgi:transcription antitermination factor NusA-like protein